jgi:hypothetical protein
VDPFMTTTELPRDELSWQKRGVKRVMERRSAVTSLHWHFGPQYLHHWHLGLFYIPLYQLSKFEWSTDLNILLPFINASLS